MKNLDDLKAAAFCLFIGGGLFYHAIKKHRQSRKIQDTPTSKTATAAVGTAEFEGFAWHTSEKYPTASGMEAVYYSFQIQQEISSGVGKNKKSEWVTVFGITKGQSFYLVDPTGLAEVHLHEADLNLESARTRAWRSLPKDEQIRIQKEIVNIDVPNFPPSSFLFGIFSVKTRIVENEILLGSPVYALGNFMTPSSEIPKFSAAGLSHFCSRVFDNQRRSLRKLSGLLDKNGDGKVDALESKTGYSLLAKVSIKKATTEAQQETEFPVHGHITTSDAQKLIVADAHQAQLLERMTHNLWFKFIGGAALMTFGIILFINPKLDFKRSNIRQPSSQAAPQIDLSAEITRLHYECVQSQVASCSRLIEKQKTFELSAVNLVYYKQQRCRLDSKQCAK